jgi:protocatechuate 3,4-dioxygenase beta subunit
MMQNDPPQGRLVSRREAIRLLGGGMMWLAAGGMLAGRSLAEDAAPMCLFRPEQTEGPYFVDEKLHRSDIRSDPATGDIKAGAPLALTVALSRVDRGQCRPLSGAQVDIWHCDALGIYSDVKDPSFNTIGRKFLRGYQITGHEGEARFLTIYPGWYEGRTVHIHLKVRTPVEGNQTYEFTSQMYFEDAVSDRVHGGPPYNTKGVRTARNHHDRIFRRGGEQLLLTPTPKADGYAAVFAVALQIPSR